jgi:hypothetical protein
MESLDEYADRSISKAIEWERLAPRGGAEVVSRRCRASVRPSAEHLEGCGSLSLRPAARICERATEESVILSALSACRRDNF